jgi:hypothetical protein
MEAWKIDRVELEPTANDAVVVFEDGETVPFTRWGVIRGAYRDKESYYGYLITTLRDLTSLPKTYCHPFVEQIIHLLGLDKVYYFQYNVGKSKYVVNYHDGEKKHPDGSDFYDIFLTNNKRTLAKFVNGLKKQGYTERMFTL